MAAPQSKSLERRPASTNGLATRDPIQLAEHFARSGYFKDTGDLSKAVVKIVAGEELGIGPMGSMQGIHIIEGKPSLSANLLAGLVKRHPNYDYKVREHTDESCTIEFKQDGEVVGDSTFTVDDAKQAGVFRNTWQKYPKAMLFARALSQGVRWHCPDVTAGSPAYVPEELGAEVTEEGEPVQILPPPSDDGEAAAQEQSGEPESANGEVLCSSDQVELIIGGFKAQQLTGNQIGLMIGAVGGEKQKMNRADSILKALRSLTPDQADRLIADLEAEAVAADGS